MEKLSPDDDRKSEGCLTARKSRVATTGFRDRKVGMFRWLTGKILTLALALRVRRTLPRLPLCVDVVLRVIPPWLLIALGLMDRYSESSRATQNRRFIDSVKHKSKENLCYRRTSVMYFLKFLYADTYRFNCMMIFNIVLRDVFVQLCTSAYIKWISSKLIFYKKNNSM